jgi:hypothetical protein
LASVLMFRHMGVLLSAMDLRAPARSATGA